MAKKAKNCKQFEAENCKERWSYNGFHYDTELDAKWAAFFDAMGIYVEYKNTRIYINGEAALYFVPTFSANFIDRREEENKPFGYNTLYIEVMENWNSTRIQLLTTMKQPLLIVKELPPQWYNAFGDYIYFNGKKTDLTLCNYYNIDNDFFGCFFGVPKDGKVVLCGNDSSYWNLPDKILCFAALWYARKTAEIKKVFEYI